MKKIFTFLLLIVAFTSLSFAQLEVGLKAGGNIASWSGDDVGGTNGFPATDSKFGFAFGGFLIYQFSPIFSVQPEAYYTMKGATDKIDVSGSTINLTWSADYIEIPVLLKLMIPVRGSNINPAIFAGPFVGINTTHKGKAEGDGQSAEADISNFKSTEFGLQFGGGLGFSAGNGELGFDIRYILGLTTLDDSANASDIKNNVINFNVFYGFSLR
jgi:hypothetical protein